MNFLAAWINALVTLDRRSLTGTTSDVDTASRETKFIKWSKALPEADRNHWWPNVAFDCYVVQAHGDEPGTVCDVCIEADRAKREICVL